MKKTKGFTLVELLLVIAIIAILTAVILTNLTQARAKSRDTKRIADISQIQLALAMHLNRFGHYPETLNTLEGDSDSPKFIAEVPKDPSNVDYDYKPTDADETGYCLGATLETTTSYTGISATCDSGDSTNNYKVSK